MLASYYKVSGRFEVYDKDGILVTDQLFINKIFEALFPEAAKNMGLAFAKRRARKKYGKGIAIALVSNLRLRKSHLPIKTKKVARDKKTDLQLLLF